MEQMVLKESKSPIQSLRMERQLSERCQSQTKPWYVNLSIMFLSSGKKLVILELHVGNEINKMNVFIQHITSIGLQRKN